MNQELINILKVQTESYNSTEMENYIIAQIESMGLTAIVDGGNIYTTKGIADYYPCIVSHMDSVHKIIPPEDYDILSNGSYAMGINTKTITPTGCGGDDKVGIYACLRLLQEYEFIKVAFFRDEEVGCNGSYDADINFFEDVRFILQCDRKGNSDFVNNIYNVKLQNNKFTKKVAPLLKKHGYKFSTGMMTDVYALTQIGVAVSVANISCGYYNPHSDDEIVVFKDVENCLNLCRSIFDTMTDVYFVQRDTYSKPVSHSSYSYNWEDVESGWDSAPPVHDYQSNYEMCTGCNEWKKVHELKFARRYDSYLCTDCIETYA